MEVEVREPAGAPRGTVALLHGFTRSPQHLQATASRMLGLGARVMLPSLSAWWWPRNFNNTRYLTRLARTVAHAGEPLVVVGHSAGAAAGAWVAGQLSLMGAPVSALVFVDGVESPAGSIRRSWDGLSLVPVTALFGEPSRCNRQRALAAWLVAHPRRTGAPVEIIDVPGMGHGDIEGPSRDPLGRSVYTRMCGDRRGAPGADLLARILDGRIASVLDAGAH